MANQRERTPVDQHLHVAKVAVDRGDLTEARGHLRQVMTILALHSNEAYIRAKVKEVRRIEATIAFKSRSQQLGPGHSGPASAASRNSPVSRLTKRASHVDYLLSKGQLREAQESLEALRRELAAVGDSDLGARALRTAVRDLSDRASKFEAARKLGTSKKRKPRVTTETKPAKTAKAAPTAATKPQAVEHFVCDRCQQRHRVDQGLTKPGKERVCVLCATGQVCTSCHRSKSPEFEFCVPCSGGGGRVRIVYAGAFESNRARH